MRHAFFALVVIIITMVQCKKKEKLPVTSTPVIPVAETIQYKIDSTSLLPGVIGTITSDRAIKKDTSTVRFGPTNVLLFKIDSLHYGFIVPIIVSGSYHIDLNSVNGEISPIVTIRPYQTVENPDNVINKYLLDYDILVDSLEKNNFRNSITVQQIELLKQFRKQLNSNILSLNAEQKKMIAYQINHYQFDRKPLKKSSTDTAYIISRLLQDVDPFEIALSEADISNLQLHATELARKAAVASCFAWILTAAPNFGVSFLFLAGTYIYLKAKAWDQNRKTAQVACYAEELISYDGTGNSSNHIELTKGISFIKKIIGRFRTLSKSDRLTITHPPITELINLNEVQEKNDVEFKSYINRLQALFNNLMGEITTTYTLYISPILNTALTKTGDIKKSIIKVSSISNPNISATIIDGGIGGLQFTFTNPDNSITNKVAFTFTLSYTQPNTQNTKSITLHANFNPGLKIGDKAHGGIVFFIDQSGIHGLVSAPFDQSAVTTWYNAFTACSSYNGDGYTDWFLPSSSQLALMYQQRFVIGGFNTDCTNANFGNCSYWSSTENGVLFAENLYFTSGTFWSNYGKDGLARARAIRTF